MLTSLPLSINIAFATALVPAISHAKAKKDNETIKKRASFSLLISMLIGLACTIGMFMFSEQILNLLFPNASSGATVLAISSFTIIFTILDQTINATLQGYGRVKIPAIAFGCRSNSKTYFKFNFSSNRRNWSKWGCICICNVPFGCFYNWNDCFKKNNKIGFNFYKICS